MTKQTITIEVVLKLESDDTDLESFQVVAEVTKAIGETVTAGYMNGFNHDIEDLTIIPVKALCRTGYSVYEVRLSV